jgi:hypothetical protein
LEHLVVIEHGFAGEIDAHARKLTANLLHDASQLRDRGRMMLVGRLLSQPGMDQQQEHLALAKRLVALPAHSSWASPCLRADKRLAQGDSSASPASGPRIPICPTMAVIIGTNDSICFRSASDPHIHLHQHSIHRIEKPYRAWAGAGESPAVA